MKRIIITEKQLRDFILLKEDDAQNGVNITVDNIDKMTPEEFNKFKLAANTLGDKASFTTKIDPNSVTPADIKKLTDSKKFNKPQINEELDDVSENVKEDVAKYVVDNWGDDIGPLTSTDTVKDMIQDAYIEVVGEEMDYSDKKLYRDIMRKIHMYLYQDTEIRNESVIITKKQIKEAQKNKRIAESKVITKSDFMKSLK